MKQYRTKYKDVIIDYMKQNEDHRLCAKDIYQALVDKGLNVNLVTVYRNLDKLSLCQRRKVQSSSSFIMQEMWENNSFRMWFDGYHSYSFTRRSWLWDWL